MQEKRRRISMANMSAQPRPEERSLGRRVSKDVPENANGVITETFFETPCLRAAPQNEVRGRIAVSVFGRRPLALGLGAAITLAASLAVADPPPFLSPEATLTFGDFAEASPLLDVFTVGNMARSPGLEVSGIDWNRHREEPQGVERRPSFRTGSGDAAIQSCGASSLDRFASARDDGGGSTESAKASTPLLPDRASQVVYDPTVGPSLSPTQSALQACRWNGSSRATINATLSAQATGAPRAQRSLPSMPSAFMRRYGSAKPA